MTTVPTPGASPCAECAGDRVPGHNFCEACGRSLRRERWHSSAAPPGPCTGCGADQWGADGFCQECGRRRAAGRDHAALALPGVVAVTDKGRRKPRNEDAVAIGRVDGGTGPVLLVVLADGVSSSLRADEAAVAAVESGMAGLLAGLAGGAGAEAATAAATAAAAAAVAALTGPDTAASPPSCTYVSAVVSATELVVGWVGDSRGYWLAGPDGSRCLTDDDAAPGSGALVRWLGADAGPTEPRTAVLRPEHPGRVLLCSDGLHRYRGEAAELAGSDPGAPPASTVAALTEFALAAGGVDNIAIALIPFPPAPEETE